MRMNVVFTVKLKAIIYATINRSMAELLLLTVAGNFRKEQSNQICFYILKIFLS